MGIVEIDTIEYDWVAELLRDAIQEKMRTAEILVYDALTARIVAPEVFERGLIRAIAWQWVEERGQHAAIRQDWPLSLVRDSPHIVAAIAKDAMQAFIDMPEAPEDVT